jgi:hypothetical protein
MTISATTAPNLQIGPVANQGPEQFEGLRVIVEVQVPAGRLRRARGALDCARKLRSSARGVLDPASHDRAGSADTLAGTVGEVPVRLAYRLDIPPGDPPVAASDAVDTLRLAGIGRPRRRGRTAHASVAARATAASSSTTTPPRTALAAGAP